eukprot:Pgem_evm1s9137
MVEAYLAEAVLCVPAAARTATSFNDQLTAENDVGYSYPQTLVPRVNSEVDNGYSYPQKSYTVCSNSPDYADCGYTDITSPITSSTERLTSFAATASPVSVPTFDLFKIHEYEDLENNANSNTYIEDRTVDIALSDLRVKNSHGYIEAEEIIVGSGNSNCKAADGGVGLNYRLVNEDLDTVNYSEVEDYFEI